MLKVQSEGWLESIIEERVRAFKRAGGDPFGIVLPVCEWPAGRQLVEANVDGQSIQIVERGDCEDDRVYVVDRATFEGIKRMPHVSPGGIILQ